jgi:ribosomal protein S18 acetylase RimI-like enzyme
VFVIRAGEARDLETAAAVWLSANLARRDGRPLTPEHGARVRAVLARPDTFLLIAEGQTGVVGMAAAMQGRADDGAGPPVPGLCHVGMVAVVPERWGEGIGDRLVDALFAAARERGYRQAQLWTHADNLRAQRLYDRRGFRRSGRQKIDDLGEPIVYYARPL